MLLSDLDLCQDFGAYIQVTPKHWGTSLSKCLTGLVSGYCQQVAGSQLHVVHMYDVITNKADDMSLHCDF